MAKLQLVDKPERLTEETWGERLYRALHRKRLSVRAIADALEPVQQVSPSTVARLFARDRAPAATSQQGILAGLVLAAAGYDPADFDMPLDQHLLYRQPPVVAEVRARLPVMQLRRRREQIRSYLASARWGTAHTQIAAA